MLLLLAEYYSLTTNDLTTEITERTEDARSVLKGIPGSLQRCDPCGAVGSNARQPGDHVRLARLPAALVAAAIGPGRVGLRRCCQSGLACLAGTGGRRAGRSEITGSREAAKPRSSGFVDQYMNQGGHFALSGDGRQQHDGLLCGSARLLQLRPVEAGAVNKALGRIGLSSCAAERQPPHHEAF